MDKGVVMLVSNPFASDPRVQREAKALVQAGYPVTVIAWDRQGEFPAEEVMDGIQVQRIQIRAGYGSGLRRLARLPAFYRQALARLHRIPWSIIHCHDLDTLPVGYLAGRLRRRPIIFDAHESYPDLVAPALPGWAVGLMRWLERLLVRRVDRVITVGDLLARHYRQWTQRVAVVRNCSAPAQPGDTPAEIRTQLGLENAALVLNYIGGFTPGRIILPFLEAVSDRPDVGLILVGKGSQFPAIKQLVDKASNIHYIGPSVPPDQVEHYTNASDVLYYGLRADYPNNRFSSPNTLYRALAAGRPLITTNVGEVARIVEEEGCGLVLPQPTREACGQAIDQLRDEALRTRMGAKSRQAWENNYNWHTARKTLLTVYAELVNG